MCVPICGYVHMPSKVRTGSWKSHESGVLDGLDLSHASSGNQTWVLWKNSILHLTKHLAIIPAL